MKLTLKVSPIPAVKILSLVVLLLVVMNVIVQVLHYQTRYNRLLGLYSKFNLNGESNIPVYFSVCMLLAVAALLGIIAKGAVGDLYQRHWTVLSGIFLFLSLDELSQVHEWVGSVLARLVGITSIARWYVWLIPFGLLLVLFVASFVRFLLRLEVVHRVRMLWAGGLYVGGAVGMELVAAWHALNHQVDSLGHAMIYTVEEALEMAGIVLFIFTLLEYLRVRAGEVHVHLVLGPADRA